MDPSLDGMVTSEYKKLAAHLKCESCKGHCHIMRGGQHQRLDFKEMSYWAKQNVWLLSPFHVATNQISLQALGTADIHNPPNALSLDHHPKCSRPNPCSGSASGREIYVHLQGLGDALWFGRFTLGNLSSTSGSGSSSFEETPVSSSLSHDGTWIYL